MLLIINHLETHYENLEKEEKIYEAVDGEGKISKSNLDRLQLRVFEI